MGAALPKPVCSTVLERQASKDFKVGLAEMNGWRSSMEDAHVVHLGDGEGYFGILDGHGGADCSAWCAKRLHEVLRERGCPTTDAAAKKLCLDTDAEFQATGLTGGSTAAMCVVRPPKGGGGVFKIHVINAGDSRVLLSRADGSIVDGGGTDSGLSTDHKPNDPSERARIERCGGRVEEAMGGVHRVNGDLAVSRGFGDFDYKKTGGPSPEDRPVTANPEMGHFECGATDFVIIVCDGVSEGTFTNAEVCKLAADTMKATGGDAAKACEAVCMRAVDTNSKDNISCMIVLLAGDDSAGVGKSREARTSYSTSGAKKEHKPGSIVGMDNPAFVKAYVAMCERGGVSLPEAVQHRHAILTARKGTADAQEEDEAELELISKPMGEPVGAEGSAERAQWFVEWAKACQAGQLKGGADGDEGGSSGGGGPDGGVEQLMMMSTLAHIHTHIHTHIHAHIWSLSSSG